MATWETARPVAKWLPNGSLRRIPAEIKIVRITGGKSDETTFEVGEAVKMVTERGRELDATFLGDGDRGWRSLCGCFRCCQ